jgi:hypothetical protein
VSDRLPYGKVKHTVIYDNDEAIDVYTDEFVMALAASGRIDLVGMLTSTSVAPFNRHVPAEAFVAMQRDRLSGCIAARRSGFTGIPDPLPGTKGHLERPDSGRVEDTRPLGSPGSKLIIDTARSLPADSRLLLIMGGPLTVAADAVLAAPDVADRLTVAWLGGRLDDMGDYNGWADPWAATTVATTTQLVAFPTLGDLCDPKVSKEWIRKSVPNSPMKELMSAKYHEPTGLPDGRDADGPPAVPLVTGEYVREAKRVRVDGFTSKHDHSWIPTYRDDPNGDIWVVVTAEGAIATREWRRAFLEAHR